MLHVQDVDSETTCTTLIRCLENVKRWSDGHPGHLPLMVLVEAKDEAIIDPLQLGFAVPLPFGPEEFDDLDDEILRRAFESSARLDDADLATQRSAALGSIRH